MLFTVSTAHSLQLQHSSDQHLAFVRYYCNNDYVDTSDKAKDLNMLHLNGRLPKSSKEPIGMWYQAMLL